ncbi:MAG TPA: nucleoside deaminase [Chryseolinea sp.]|nr:nucleoside deaminase [Chryseolinea sp.]
MEKRDKETNAADHEFMKRAMELSQLAISDGRGDPFGSVLVKDGKIIGEGWNKTRLLKDPSAHAEIEAIRDACKKLDKTDLSGSAIYTSAQPCPMCLSLIYLTGIKRIYYCIPHSKIEKFNKDLSVEHIYVELSRPQAERTIPEVQILSEHADHYLKSYTLTKVSVNISPTL